MSTPSRSRSSARGDKCYFDWRESMERQQRESERQVQALLQETRKLKEENEVLRIQVSSSESPRSQQPRGPRCNQEVTYLGNASPPLDVHGVWPNEGPVPTHCAPQEESSDSTRVSSKRQCEKRPQLFDTMRARLGPQDPRKDRPHTTTSQGTYPRPSNAPISQGYALYQSMSRVGGDSVNEAPLGSISRQLHNMLSTPFSPCIINYEPPKRVLRAKIFCE